MTELALSVLDLATNSQRAGADEIKIEISVNLQQNLLSLVLSDNGKGMDSNQLKNATDPFFTTRTTRRVGMGLPLFEMMCQASEGSFEITSETAKTENAGKSGTTIRASLRLTSVDRPPLGDMGSTIVTLMQGDSSARYIFCYSLGSSAYTFDTDEVKKALDGDIAQPAVLTYLGDMINENIENINGGLTI